MVAETVDIALSVLDDLRKHKGHESEVYNTCCEFFETLNWCETHENLEVLYNPILKKHELVVK